MAETAGRLAIRDALDTLKPCLAAYVNQVLGGSEAKANPSRSDMQALIGTILTHWDSDFAARLPVTVRHYLHELRNTRNRWAHEEPFDDAEAMRAIDTARLIAKAIGAPMSPSESASAQVQRNRLQ